MCMKNAWENYRENMNWANLQRLANEAKRTRLQEASAQRVEGMTPEQLASYRAAEEKGKGFGYGLTCGCLFVLFAALAALVVWFVWESYF